MDFVTAVKTCLNKYAAFQGRAARSEFWYFTLFNWLFQLLLMLLDAALGTPFTFITMLVLLLPGIAVAVRRLHDTNRSGWWYLILLIPLVGVILFIVWASSKGTLDTNRFGDTPLDGKGEPVTLSA
ncbi:MAG: DUF805 domain-containing protein [Rhodospirillaceae bacterium]|nr:DUF805 domain-containing protein [Rhodospirillales bacterium]